LILRCESDKNCDWSCASFWASYSITIEED
jgi:hypothetical protein